MGLYLKIVDFVQGRRWQPHPHDLLLVFADNVHCHEHIQCVVNASPDVFLVKRCLVAGWGGGVRTNRRRKACLLVNVILHLLDEFFCNLVVRGAALLLNLVDGGVGD